MQLNWMEHAWALFGVAEIAGPGAHPDIVATYRDVGHPTVKSDEVPWCAAFVGACLERSGIASTRSLLARSYLSWGDAAEEPVFGALAVLSRGSDPNAGHVGFVVGHTGDALFLLGGNQANAVSVARFNRSRLLGFRWPATQLAPGAAGARDGTALDAVGYRLFDSALGHVLEMEGGYTDDPHDPGGPTNKGITLGVFARARGVDATAANRAELVRSLQTIGDDEVRRIYLTRYWLPSRADALRAGLALMHFDASVNHGVVGAARLLQRALGVEVDGKVGPITLGAAARVNEHDAIRAYAQLRRERYRELHHFWRFGRGWLRRVDTTESRALKAMSTQSGAASRPQPDPTPQPRGRTPMSQTPQTQTEAQKWWLESMTLWGAFITTISTIVPIIGPLFGIHLTSQMIEQIGQHGVAILQALAGLAGIFMTVLGRFRARTRLSAFPVTDERG